MRTRDRKLTSQEGRFETDGRNGVMLAEKRPCRFSSPSSISLSSSEEYCHIGRVDMCSVLSGHGGFSDVGADGTGGVRGRSGGLKTFG